MSRTFSLSRAKWSRGYLANTQPFLYAGRANSTFLTFRTIPAPPVLRDQTGCSSLRGGAMDSRPPPPAILTARKRRAGWTCAPLGATRVERRAALAFQADHVERSTTPMMAILAQVVRENVGSSRHQCHIPFLTESLKIRVHIDNAAGALWARVVSRF